MAFTGTRTYNPQGETPIQTETREIPEHYEAITYLVHPSPGADGDRKLAAKAATLSRVASIPLPERQILILPPGGSTYIDDASSATDVRSDADDNNWVQEGDITDSVRNVTLIGGSLERCLGSVNTHVLREISNREENRNIAISLPLDAIYTLQSTTAEQELSRLLAESGDLHVAVVALLLAATPFNREYQYGEIPLLREYAFDYVISLNGKVLHRFIEPQDKEEDIPEGWIMADEQKANPRIELNLSTTDPLDDVSPKPEKNIKLKLAREFIKKRSQKSDVVR